MGIETEPKNWYRDEFLLSTEQSLLQVDVIYEAMDSDALWWTQAIPKDALRKALRNSLSFGLYELPQSTSQIAGKTPLLPSVWPLVHYQYSRTGNPEANWPHESYHR